MYVFASMAGNEVLWDTHEGVSDVSPRGDGSVRPGQKYSLERSAGLQLLHLPHPTPHRDVRIRPLASRVSPSSHFKNELEEERQEGESMTLLAGWKNG